MAAGLADDRDTVKACRLIGADHQRLWMAPGNRLRFLDGEPVLQGPRALSRPRQFLDAWRLAIEGDAEPVEQLAAVS